MRSTSPMRQSRLGALGSMLAGLATVGALMVYCTPQNPADWAIQQTASEIEQFCERLKGADDGALCAGTLQSIIENHDKRRAEQLQGVL